MERQGEVFFYKHQQMLTRYVAERVAWRLPDLESFFGLPSQTYPKQDKGFVPPATLRHVNEHWPFPFVSRPAGESPAGLADGTDFDMINMEKQVNLFLEMIEKGELPDGRPLDLDMLGRVMEQHITGMQWPKKFGYEGVRNAMHDLWSIVGQGPDTTNYGVMGQGLDSARDPFTVHRARPCPDEKVVTARIFMAPTETCADHKSWIEMDKFTVRVAGQQQEVTRKCIESSVVRLPGDLCGCGWPYNLMVPAGCPEGMEFMCVLILTENDRTEKPGCCKGADPIVECASKSGGVYPDLLPMERLLGHGRPVLHLEGDLHERSWRFGRQVLPGVH